MKVKFRQKFEKDLESILDQKVLDAIADTISDVENAQKIQEIKNIKKMKGSKNAYRIKINRHRIGLFLVDDTFEFTRVLPRDKIYKFFP
jgi:mRNA-degrading endonuclease RelE of RelBE toxin-antitoxin system